MFLYFPPKSPPVFVSIIKSIAHFRLIMKTEVLEEQGKRILLIDYTQCKNDMDMIKVVDEAATKIIDPTIKFTLTDVTGMKFTTKYTDHVKPMVKSVFYPNTNRNAVVGVKGVQGIILSGLNLFSRSKRKMVSFDNRQEAIQYLVTQ